MSEVMLPWGLFAGAVGAAILYLQLLPEIFARRRFGGRAGLEGSLWWLCLAAVFGLMAWPFFAAVHIDWRRAPTFITIIMMTAGAGVAGFVMQLAVQAAAGAYLSSLMADDDAPALMQFSRRFAAVVTIALIGLTAGCYWTLSPDMQSCLQGYCP